MSDWDNLLAHLEEQRDYALGLVERYGDRANGPCPALVRDGERFACGLMRRPKDYLTSSRGVTVLRNAVALLIGAGAGCDEAGDEPDETALPKLRKIQQDYLVRHSADALRRAVKTLHGADR